MPTMVMKQARAELRWPIASHQPAVLLQLLEELQQELYTVGASVYQQEGAAAGAAPGADAGAGAGAAGGSSDAGDDVIDAEFTETK